MIPDETLLKNGSDPERLHDWSRETRWEVAVCKPPKVIRIVYFMLKNNEPYRGQNVEMTTRKLMAMKYRASVGLQT